MKQLSIKKLAVLIGLGVAQLGIAQTTPPNTLDMNNFPINTAPSPVMQQGLNLGLQTPINPSMSTVLNQQIVQYQSANLNPQQVADIKVQEALKSKMTSTPYLSTPNPVVRSLLVDLAPDSTPPIMRVSAGMLSTLVFTDTDGQPWEIEQVQADARLFRVHGGGQQSAMANQTAQAQSSQSNEPLFRLREDGSLEQVETPTQTQSQPQAQQALSANALRPKNMVMIEPIQAWSGSNIVVLLKGKQTPVIILVTAGQNEVDLRLDMKVQGSNPDRQYSPLSMGSSGVQNITGIDNNILGFLDGRIPDTASLLRSSDGAVQAWDFNGKTFVKTRFDVLHPAYTAKVSTGENTHVYRFDDLGENRMVTFLQRYGQPVTVSFDSVPYYAK